MINAVIFDIDGTLADASHRLHHVTGDKRDWPAFFAAMGDDPCHEPINDLARAMRHDGNQLVLCSGRPEDYRAVTEAWLLRYEVPWDDLYMRASGDTRPDHVVKAEMLRAMRKDGYEPWLVVDDRPSVVAMWREQGLTCLQCRDWNEAPKVAPGLLTLMVGPSGAGKTTWLYRPENQRAYCFRAEHVVSSDQIRADLCGDFRDQTRNAEVFAALHAVVKARVRVGLPTVVDATNLHRKDRLAVLALSPGGPVRYLVMDRPMEEKRATAGWRAELPIDLLAKHDQTFRSQLDDILRGDGLPNVTVIDLR